MLREHGDEGVLNISTKESNQTPEHSWRAFRHVNWLKHFSCTFRSRGILFVLRIYAMCIDEQACGKVK